MCLVDLLSDELKDQALLQEDDSAQQQEADYNDAKKTAKRLISAITINDEPDLEYDDEIGSLVAEQLGKHPHHVIMVTELFHVTLAGRLHAFMSAS